MSNKEEPLPDFSKDWEAGVSPIGPELEPKRRSASVFEISEAEETSKTIDEGMSEEDIEDLSPQNSLVEESTESEEIPEDDAFTRLADDLDDETDEEQVYLDKRRLEVESEDKTSDGAQEDDSDVSEEIALPTDEELESSPDQDDENVIYKTEKPVLKLLMWIAITAVVIILILGVIGFVIGYTGGHPPTLDSEILRDKWNDLAGGGSSASPTPVDELVKSK